jgi:diadenosine tetraphosphate (Ap4A) HIT family hydrolase
MLQFSLPIAELEVSRVQLCRDSDYPGRCCVVLKDHKNEVYMLEDEQRTKFFAEVSEVARAIKKVFKADKVNLAVFGDTVTHVHCHVVPKTAGGPEWGVPFKVDRFEMPGEEPVYMSNEKLAEWKNMLIAELKGVTKVINDYC